MSVIGSNALAGASGQGGGGDFVIEKSLRFNNDDTPYLNRTPSSAGNRTTWTWSSWVKLSSIPSGNQNLFSSLGTTGNQFYVYFNTSSKLIISDYEAYVYTRAELASSRVFRDFSGWYHLVIVMDSSQATAADRVKLYVNGVQETLTGTQPNQNTQAFWNNANAHYIGRPPNNTTDIFDGYLADVYFVDGTALAPTSFGAFDDSGVWQAAAYSGSFGTNGFHLFDFANESGIGDDSSGNDNDFTVNNLTSEGGSQVRTTELSVNHASGVISQPGNAFTPTYIDDYINTSTFAVTNTAWLGSYANGYAEARWIPVGGYAVTSSLRVYFGVYSNAAASSTLTVTYTDGTTESSSQFTSGTNNWMTLFTASSAANKTIQKIEISNPSTTNVQFGGFVIDGEIVETANTGTDVLRDVPTNGNSSDDTGAGGEVSGNYCTLNPLAKTSGQDPTLTNGNLDFGAATNSNFTNSVGTIAVSSGKWYVEYTIGTNVGSSNGLGFINSESLASAGGSYGIGQASDGWLRTTSVVYNNSSSAVSSLTSISSGDVVMLALDIDNGKAWWGLNGTFENSGDPGAGSNAMVTFTPGGKSFVIGISAYHSSVVASGVINFGARSFAYSAPSGFKALCTANLPTPDVPDGADYFDAKLYDGTGAAQTITGLEFQPDFTWIKVRDNARSHFLFDSVRGATEYLIANTTGGEVDDNTTLTAFTSDGFSVGASADVNRSTSAIVSWNWDAGTSNTTVSAGSLNSAVYDQSQTWSTYGTFDNNWANSDYHWDDVFNTTLANNGDGSLYVDGTTKDTWNLSSSYAVSNTIKVYTQNPTEITINEGLSSEKVVTSDGGTSLHFYEFSFTGNVESVGVRHASGGGIYLMGIWFDGKQLVDDTETPTNVPAIASTYRANPSAGFSIVTYTGNGTAGATIGHGLNDAPGLILVKRRDSTGAWRVYHSSIGATKHIRLDTTAAATTSTVYWNDTEPTSSVFSIGNNTDVNGTSATFVSYCFAPVEGFSKFGTYAGNSNADGTFVHLGFKPALLIIKGHDYASNWFIHDYKRPGYNQNTGPLRLHAEAELTVTTYDLDILSNGFKMRTSGGDANQSSKNYIYMAWAENPFQANGGLAR